MRFFSIIITILWAGTGTAAPISCQVTGNNTVVVTMKTPHPNHALVYRPDGEVVWLQTGPEYIHRQIPNFSELENWVITPDSRGTAWIDGKTTIQPIIKGSGRYHLYIAENLETEPENTYFIECYFVIGENN